MIVFQESESYNLKSGNHLARKNIQTTQYWIESVSNLGAKLWDLLPGEIKSSSSLSVFKNNIGKWIPWKYPCKACQTYKKCRLYLISLDLPLYFDLNLSPYGNLLEWDPFSSANLIYFNTYKMIFYDTIYTKKNIHFLYK